PSMTVALESLSTRTAAVPPSRRRVARRMGSGSFGDDGAVEMQTFDDRRIGEREEIDTLVGLERPLDPGRDDDHVALGDVVALVREVETALTLEDLEDHRADVAAGAGVDSGAQAVELGADRRHDVAAGGGVGVADGGVARFRSSRVALVLE